MLLTMAPWILRGRNLPLTTAVIIAALVALALLDHGPWLDAVLTVVGWGGAFIAFLLLATGWMRAGAVVVAVAITAIGLSLLIG
jgi:hypothetical protein